LSIPIHDKIAHPYLNPEPFPFPEQPAQQRRPCGTRTDPLNAARFPAWHGSREPVAQDRCLNTAYSDSKTARTRVWEFIPAIADCRSQGTAISPT